MDEEVLEFFKELTLTEVRINGNLVAIKLPKDNQTVSVNILRVICYFTESCERYCHICGDSEALKPGEIGIKLKPGNEWVGVIQQIGLVVSTSNILIDYHAVVKKEPQPRIGGELEHRCRVKPEA